MPDSDVALAVSLYYCSSFLFRVPQQGVAARVLANNTLFLTANERITFTDIYINWARGKTKNKNIVFVHSRCSNQLDVFKDQQVLRAESNVVERVNNFDARNVQVSYVDADMLSMLLSASSRVNLVHDEGRSKGRVNTHVLFEAHSLSQK